MKVLRRDEHVLTLRPSGGWLLLITGIVVLATAPLWLRLLGTNTVLLCERETDGQPHCTISQRILGKTIHEKPIGILQGAYIERDEGEDDTLYRVILRTDAGNVPLTSGQSTGYRHKAAFAAQVNEFVTNSTASSAEIVNRDPASLIISVIVLVADIGILIGGLQTLTTTWTFNRDTQRVTKSCAIPFLSRTRSYPLQDIVDAAVAQSRDRDANPTYRIELVTQVGSSIPMSGWYTSGYKRKQEAADLIRSFLKLA